MCSHVWSVSGKVFVVVVSSEELKPRRAQSTGRIRKGPLGIKLELVGQRLVGVKFASLPLSCPV